MEKQVIKFPQYVSSPNRTVNVVGFIEEGAEYIDGKGYLDEKGNIWIYCLKGKPLLANEYPYFWIEEGENKFSNPSEDTKKTFTIQNLVDASFDTIMMHTEDNEVLFDEEEINDINSAAAFYVPIIKNSDDFLKKLVKNVIIQKKIDINRLKTKTDEKYQLPNMKAALNNNTKMSVTYFKYWMELLGCEFNIQITDSGYDKNDPLKNPLVYDSHKDRVSAVINGKYIDLNVSQTIDPDEDEE